MNTKHTPGPWSFSLVRVQRQILDQFGRPLAYTHGININEDEDFANARLIAAAPELLEALHACRKELSAWMRDHGSDIGTQEAVTKARAAIAKATGQ